MSEEVRRRSNSKDSLDSRRSKNRFRSVNDPDIGLGLGLSVKSKPKLTEKERIKQQAEKREHILANRTPGFVVQYLVRRTHFDQDEVKALQLIYRAFKEKGKEKVDRLGFRDMVSSLYGISNNEMLDRIFLAFDLDGSAVISEAEWIIGLSALLRGTLEQQSKFVYDVYDINGDRSLGRDEIAHSLRGCFHIIPGVMEGDEIDEATKDIVELVLKRLDINHDSNIQVSEFKHMVRHDPTILELLGECLPNDGAVMPLVALLNKQPRNYKLYLSPPGDIGWLKERKRYDSYTGNHLHEEYLHEEDEGRGLHLEGKPLPVPASTRSSMTILKPHAGKLNKQQKDFISKKHDTVENAASIALGMKLKHHARHTHYNLVPLRQEKRKTLEANRPLKSFKGDHAISIPVDQDFLKYDFI